MDQERFDGLTRALADAMSRRGALKGIAGLVTGSLLAAIRERPATAGTVPRGHPCTRPGDCGECNDCQPVAGRNEGRCVPAADGSSCAICGRCRGGRCAPDDARCPSGCGGCGPDLTCRNGRCTGCGQCYSGGICRPFNSSCMGPDTSDDHCQGCDPVTFTCLPPVKCGPCESCIQNTTPACQYQPAGRNGECDPNRRPCDPETGKCSCRPDQILCDKECVDPQTDAKHCGDCNKQCGKCQICRDGTCQPCDPDCQTCDNGQCVSDCGSPCLDCERGHCVNNYKCVACTMPPPASALASLPLVRWFVSGADTPEPIQCGPCEECDPDQGCRPKTCDGPCEQCDPNDGECKAACPPKQCCDGTCCQNDETCCQGTCCASDMTCCDDGSCKADCGGQKIYCGCNKTCYDSASACLAECRAGLGCFSNICGPAEPGQC